MVGRFTIIVLCLGAVVLSIQAASWTPLPTWVSLAASSTAFVAMSLNLFLAARPPMIETAFGGLDRIYGVHRALGITVLVLVLVHYVLTPNFKGVELTSDTNRLAKLVGQITFFCLCALAAVSLVKRIPYLKAELPYHWWRMGHRLMGVVFCFAAFHQFFIKRPFDGDVALVDYLTTFALLGVLSFACAEMLPFLRRRRYEITNVTRLPGATRIEARPLGRPARIRPGQFAFLSATRGGLGEPHPFTVAGQDSDGTLRFMIKPSGDYTKRLRETLAVGDRLRIEGGYGRFSYTRGGDTQVWLAGGIGITPFLAMAEALGGGETRQIHLVHSVRDRQEAFGNNFIEARTHALPAFTYTIHETATQGRLDATTLQNYLRFDIAQADLWFCGPTALRTSLIDGLRRSGLRFRRVEFEQFEFR